MYITHCCDRHFPITATVGNPGCSRFPGLRSSMAPYRIRQYEDSDYEVVRTMFGHGIKEHALTGYIHMLKCLQTQLLFLGLFLAVLAASGSLLVSLLALLLTLIGGWFCVRSLWTDYVQQSLRSDLLDIRRTYVEAADSCLWVAEAEGAVVGMVGAVLPEDPLERGRALELKRMSVGREHRGWGIGRALCRTVIHFAQERGYSAVVLSTSMVQYSAQQLYESVGFQRVSERSPSLLASFLQFSVFYYRYEIPGSG
ncbi:N-acetyltransferase family 8 member 3-like isoform X1 [Gopherus flavomarginatus]|uniref:N-acetyltransferase family 8 member 3-like isoform X1 n=2 Tax=Gopherus flavomarginatus TaxID=286002 RepID=UPI0021CBC1D1|nr:N-acetyltransferase family 8 member 3-like isoform X1 [Gopherus flavomarginatus]